MNLGLDPLDQRSMETHVCERLTELLVSGRLLPGTRLTEERLAAELGVSRTPIREALRRLAQDGLVELLPRRGINLRRLSRAEVRELYQIRGVLEGLATFLATNRLTQEDIDYLKAGAEQEAQDLAAGKAEFWDLDVELHGMLIERCGNGRLQKMLESLHNISRYSRSQYVGTRDPANPSHGEHLAILDAIEQRDPALAEKKMRDHLLAAGERAAMTVPSQDEDSISSLK